MTRTVQGREDTSPSGPTLRAGPLTAELAGANLRSLRAGDLDLVQRIYVAVRDSSWNVILPRVRVLERAISSDSFEVRFQARHRDGTLDFGWTGWITGTPEGRVTYRMDGVARSAFMYNKIGLLVLHPVSTHAGRTVRGSGGPDGSFVGRFPSLVGPQAVRDGHLQGIFPPFRSLSIQLDDHADLDLDFDGDDFEMEDERNWTESGYKSYGGPLSRPWPVSAKRGQVIRQTVAITYRGAPRSPIPHIEPSVTIGEASTARVPLIGHSVPDEGPALSSAEASLLRLAHPSFVQADLRLAKVDVARLETVGSTLAAIDRPLLASLYLGDDPLSEVDRFVQWCISSRIALLGMVLFAQQGPSVTAGGTPAETIQALLPMLREVVPDVQVAVGSDRFLSEVIRSTPTTNGADAIAFGVSPSGHADEDWAIIENLPAQGDAIRTLQASLGATPIMAGPITLQTRYGAWPRYAFRTEDLPPQVDVRQRSVLGAAWTLGSVRELTMAGASLAIYYENLGWRGLFERESGSAMPTQFPSRPLEAFPVLHVFADLGELRSTRLLDTDVRGAISALAFDNEGLTTVLVANLSPAKVQVRVGPLHSDVAHVRHLDRWSIKTARRDPERFRRRRVPVDVIGGSVALRLEPYGYVRIDAPSRRSARESAKADETTP